MEEVLIEKVSQTREETNMSIDLECLEKKQEKEQFQEDEHNFHTEEIEMKEQIILVTMNMDKNQKYDEVIKCLKEGVHQVSQLITKWVEERSIVGVIEINGMTRREDFGQVGEWTC